MPKFSIIVTQVFRVQKETIVEIEADDQVDAINMVNDGDYEAPDFDDPVWKTDSCILEHEEARVANV